MTPLEPGWRMSNLSNFTIKIQKMDPIDTGREQVRYVDIGSLNGPTSVLDGVPQIDSAAAPSRCRQIIAPGDTLYSTVRPYLRKIGYVSEELSGEFASTGYCVLRPTHEIDSKYLFYFVQSPQFEDQLFPLQKGVSYPAVLDREVKAQLVSFPELSEQLRIVEILEEHLSHLDAGAASLEVASKRADGLLASHIATTMATAGGDEVALGDVASSVKNGIFVSRPSALPNGVPILRIGAVRPLELSLDDLRFSGMDEATLRESGALLDHGDLLFTRYNGNPRFVGASAVVGRSALPLTYPDKLIRVRLDPNRVLPEFVCFATNFGAGRRQIEAKLKTSAGQVGIAGGQLKRITIPIASLESQKRVVTSIQQVIEARARLRKTLEVAQQRHDRLRRAVLRSAFEGKLTGRHTDSEVIEELAQQ